MTTNQWTGFYMITASVMKELIKHCFTCELLFGGGYDELPGSPGYGGTSFDGGYGVD